MCLHSSLPFPLTPSPELLRREEAAKQDAATAAQTLRDRDAALDSLHTEGETLARRSSTLEATARKLRAALKEAESERDAARLQVEALQAEAVAAEEGAESDAALAHDDAARALEEALAREASLVTTLAAQAAQLANLTATVAAAEARASERQEALCADNARLERRLQEAEAARDELSSNHAEAALPLMRQLESLAAAATRARESAAETESRLQSRAEGAEALALVAEAAERSARARASAAEEKLRLAGAAACASAEQLQATHEAFEQERARADAAILQAEKEAALRATASHCAVSFEAKLSALETEHAKLCRAMVDLQKTSQRRELELEAALTAAAAQSAAQQAAHDAALLERDKTHATPAAVDAALQELAPLAPLDSHPARRGEVLELRRRIDMLEAGRKHDARLLIEAEERAASALAGSACLLRLQSEMEQLQDAHARALEVLGENAERVEELQLDLREARDIYRAQILMLCPQ